MRPRELCQALLVELDASEGVRKKRKRDTTPDAIGLGIKREMLEAAVQEDPAPDTFESWLIKRTEAAEASGPSRAMALSIWDEWRMRAVPTTGPHLG